jgi:hypothetical protein
MSRPATGYPVPPQPGHRRALSVVAIIFLLLSIFPACASSQPTPVSDSKDLVINGYLTQETGNISTDWKSDGWLTGPGISSFSWHRTAKGGELSIINHQPNDARWMSIFTSRPPCCSRHSRRTKACVFPGSVLLLEKPPKRQDTAPSSQAPPGSETGRMLPLAGGFVLMLLLIGWRNTLPPLRTCPASLRWSGLRHGGRSRPVAKPDCP